MRAGVALVLSCAVVLGMCATAYAQEKGITGSGPVLDQNTDVKLSEKEMIDNSASTVKKARKILSGLFELLEEARKDKDVLKLNVVNEKLTSGKALLKIVEQSDVNLQEALAKKDLKTAAREYEKVIVAFQKLQIIKTEAEASMGKTYWSSETEREGQTGDSGKAGGAVEVIEPKGVDSPIPLEQVATGFDVPMSSPVRPARSSPFQ